MLKFQAAVTGRSGCVAPGGNEVGLTIEGAGKAGLKLTKFFFEKINNAGIATHYVDCNIDESTMTVLPAQVFGEGVEVICRYRAVGSFLRRYGKYVMLGILTKEEYATLVSMTKKIGAIVKEELAKKELELYDIKFEFGRVGEDAHIALIDEISGGNMRAYKNGEYVEPLTLEKLMLS